MIALPNPTDSRINDPWLAGLATVAASIFSLIVVAYFLTGSGGPLRLAVLMVPVAMMIHGLLEASRCPPFGELGKTANRIVILLQSLVVLLAGTWIWWQFDALRIERVGLWQTTDLIAAGSLLLVLLEQARRSYPALFFVILLLLLYALLGPRMPGLLQHGGIDWQRAIAVASLDMSTGMFDRLAQLGLTLIAAFLLILSLLKAFGSIDAILRISAGIGQRRPWLLPQAAVVGSFAVASVSGSGAANAATTGSATIPALVRSGFPRHRAAAVETATSLGGQLMPPLMGIAAFLMAELMGVGYFEIVARGYAPALIYFAGVSLAVFLLGLRFLHPAQRHAITRDPVDWRDHLAITAWVLAVLALVVLMGVARMPAMNAALMVSLVLFTGLLLMRMIDSAGTPGRRIGQLVHCLKQVLRDFAETTSALVVLLALLGVLTALFTVTGVPTRLGGLMMEAAGMHLLLMVLLAFAFGYVVGMGLPVAPTYIIMAVVTVPFLIQAGVDPWVAHFFAFFVAVFGELSPPTSVTAAVTSRIASASFMKTMMAAMGICLPLLTLAVGVFTYPALVTQPGFAQLGAFLPVLLATLALVAAAQLTARALIRSLLAASAATLLLSPPLLWSALASAGCLFLLFWLLHEHRKSATS